MTAITVLLAAAGGAVAGNLLGFLAKRVDNLVRKTDTKLDDRVWSVVRGAMKEAMDEFVPETGVAKAPSFEDISSGH